MGGGTLTGENHLMDSANKDGARNRRIIGKDSDRATERVAKNSKKSGGYQTAAASNG